MPQRPTREYLAELERLGTAPATRGQLLARVTDLFLLTLDRQSDRDRAIFESVMTRLADTADTAHRAELAARLAAAPMAPPMLLRRLAGDEIAVARPVLEGAAQLHEADLVALVKAAGTGHADAISRRPSLSPAVTDALLATAEASVLRQLARNPGARLSRAGLEAMARRAGSDAALRDAVAARADLPEDIRDWLWRPRSDDDPEPDSGALARADEEALAGAARAGRTGEAVQELAALTGLDAVEAKHWLLGAELTSLTVLCKAHGLAAATFSALLQLRSSAGAVAPHSIAGAMRRFETMDAQAARRIQSFLRSRLARG